MSKRRMITLSGPQQEFLEQEAKRLDISVSELIRRIIDQYRDKGG